MLTTVQPFGLRAPGGGPRILRALLAGFDQPYRSVYSSPRATAELADREIHLSSRPFLGRIESTRLDPSVDVLEYVFSGRFRRRLKVFCRDSGTEVVHGLAHMPDFWPAFEVARALGCGYCLTVHDDFIQNAKMRPVVRASIRRLGRVWREADGRMVITEEMGEEYCRRYGARDYAVVTDGTERTATAPVEPSDGRRIYFMGLFHLSYIPNLTALVQALPSVGAAPSDVSLTCRCGQVPAGVWDGARNVTFLPFGSEAEVSRDIREADLLYLPLPFDRRYELFTRFSLSTKLVTYLASGLPIVYHGPQDSAAASLLGRHDAAILVPSLDPRVISEALASLSGARLHEVATNGLRLARERFDLATQQARFRDTVRQCAHYANTSR